MIDPVLVTYATRYGSTHEVAERVGAVLRDGGSAVDVQPIENVSDLSGYTAVVFGAPYYFGKMLDSGPAFLERHRSALEAMPVALFTLGPPTADGDLAQAREQIEGTLAKLNWLRPVATEMFVGKYDPTVLRGLDKFVTKLKASPMHGLGARDDRDWDAIERWANSLRLAGAIVASERA